MQPPATAPLPRYADWLTTEQVAAQVGASTVVVNGWIVAGIKTETGRIRLRAAKVGGRWRIDPAAVSEFVALTTRAALPESATPPADGRPAAVPVETAAGLKRREAAALAELRAMGINPDRPRRRTRGVTT